MKERSSDEKLAPVWRTPRRGRKAVDVPGQKGDSGSTRSQSDADKAERPVERHELEARIESLTAETIKLKRALEPLARFRTVIDHADEAIFVIDPKTDRFIDANQTALRWLGLQRKTLLTLTIHDVAVEFPLGYPEAQAALITDKRNLERPYVCGRVHRRRDGSSFPVEVAVASRQFGKRTYTLVVARESRQHRKVERAMREAEDRYYTLFNLTQEAVYLTTRGGRICDVNQAALELLGYSQAEFIELQAGKLYSEVPDTRRIKAALKANGFVRDISVRLRAKDGSLISGLLSVSPRRSGGEPVGGYQCIVRPVNHGQADQPTVVLESIDVAPKPDVGRTAAPETGSPKAAPRPAPGTSSEARTRKLGELEVGRRTQPKYQPSPAFDSAPKWHHKPWTLVLTLGAVVALFGWTDLVALTYPYNVGLPEWQLAVRLLAVTLLALGVAGQAWWRTARGVAVGLSVLGLTLLVVYINYVRGFPFELRDAVPDTQAQLDTAILGASGFAVALLLFCGWVSWRLWTGVRPEQNHPRVIT